MLELTLGTPVVFSPSPATRAAVDKQLQLKGRPAGERQLLYLLRGLMELCLYPPRVTGSNPARRAAFTGSGGDTTSGTRSEAAVKGKIRGQPGSSTNSSSSSSSSASVPLPWSCSENSLLQLVASRDPTGRGLEGGLALRLLQRLLAWDPKQRPTAAQALQHAYFTTVRNQTAAATGAQQRTPPAEVAGSTAAAGGGVGQQGGADAVKQLLQQQEAVLQECSGVAVGEHGWC
jgi:serine/threonine protein kinase